MPRTVSAQEAPRQLLLLPAEGHADTSLDVTLREVFAARLPGTTLQVSAVPLEDVRLLAGCSEDAPDCLPQIAAQLGVDALLVRRLDAAGTQLTLTLHAYGATREAATRVDEADGERAVVSLLRTLQLLAPEPPPVVLAPVPPVVLEAPRAPPRRWPTRLGWTLTAVGGGLLGAGLIAGMLSRRDERRYARVSLDDEQAVDDAHRLLSSARDHARLANGLLLGGALITL
ncbi:MAG: hypothetical protein ABW352_01420, partial [Polyangiales bacterium]